jgi:hypothetical protein
MKHYCLLRNQPEFSATVDGAKVRFEFAGGTNLDSTVDRHIHQGEIEWLTANRIRSQWDMYERGQRVESHDFELVRRPDPDTVVTATAQSTATCCSAPDTGPAGKSK